MLLSAIELPNNNTTDGFLEKLIDSSTNPRAYWSLLKTFLINRKIPCIPSLFNNNKFISNFIDKAELFNKFFAQQCTLIDNPSEIRATLNIKITKLLSLILVIRADSTKITTNLDPNKSQGHDMISKNFAVTQSCHSENLSSNPVVTISCDNPVIILKSCSFGAQKG